MNYERLNTLDKLKRQPFKDTEWMSEKWLNSNDPNRRKGKKSSKSSKKHKRFNKKYKSRGKTPRQHRRHYT